LILIINLLGVGKSVGLLGAKKEKKPGLCERFGESLFIFFLTSRVLFPGRTILVTSTQALLEVTVNQKVHTRKTKIHPRALAAILILNLCSRLMKQPNALGVKGSYSSPSVS
jgi:hypothetical protein